LFNPEELKNQQQVKHNSKNKTKKTRKMEKERNGFGLLLAHIGRKEEGKR